MTPMGNRDLHPLPTFLTLNQLEIFDETVEEVMQSHCNCYLISFQSDMWDLRTN